MIARRRAARRAHDVGMYVARTARNLRAGPVPPRLVAMLVKDLGGQSVNTDYIFWSGPTPLEKTS